MYSVKRFACYDEEIWYFNKKENTINKTIECFNQWLEDEYDGDIQEWEACTGWDYEEEIKAIKMGWVDFDFLEMKEIEIED